MSYKLYNDDCVNVCHQLPDDCIDLTITSIPFANLYTYSDDPRDFSNVKDLDGHITVKLQYLKILKLKPLEQNRHLFYGILIRNLRRLREQECQTTLF